MTSPEPPEQVPGLLVPDIERPPATQPPALNPPRWRPLGIRLARSIALVAVVVAVPLLAGHALDRTPEAIAFVIGAVVTISSAMSNGLRASFALAPLYLLVMVVGALVKPLPGHPESAPAGGWLWVAMLVLLAAVSGMATRWGIGVAASMATLYAASTPPFHDLQRLALMILFIALGSLLGALIASRLGAADRTPEPPTTARAARIIALFLALAVGAAAAIALAGALPHGSWLVAAVVVLGIPTPGLTEKAMLWRMLGQLAACAAVTAMALLIAWFGSEHATLWFGLATGVCLVGYLMTLGMNPAITIAFLSSALLLPIAAREHDHIGGIVGGRLLDNVVGLAIMGLALIAVRYLAGQRPSADGPSLTT